MSAQLLGWRLICDGCRAGYEVKFDRSLRRVRDMAAVVGWYSDDPDVKPEDCRDFCPSCKVRNRVNVE